MECSVIYATRGWRRTPRQDTEDHLPTYCHFPTIIMGLADTGNQAEPRARHTNSDTNHSAAHYNQGKGPVRAARKRVGTSDLLLASNHSNKQSEICCLLNYATSQLVRVVQSEQGYKCGKAGIAGLICKPPPQHFWPCFRIVKGQTTNAATNLHNKEEM